MSATVTVGTSRFSVFVVSGLDGRELMLSIATATSSMRFVGLGGGRVGCAVRFSARFGARTVLGELSRWRGDGGSARLVG